MTLIRAMFVSRLESVIASGIPTHVVFTDLRVRK